MDRPVGAVRTTLRGWRGAMIVASAALFSTVVLHAPTEGAGQIALRPGGPPKDAPHKPMAAPRPAGPAADSLWGEYGDLIARTAAEEGVDAALVQAIITVESGFDQYAVSRKGARGLMQLMPETASRFAVSDAFDPAANVRGGVRYLRFLQEMFPGQLHWVLAAYNAGEHAVLRHKGIPPYRETQEYVQRVLANYVRHAAVPGRRAPEPGPPARGAAELPPQTLYRVVNADLSVSYSNVAIPQTR